MGRLTRGQVARLDFAVLRMLQKSDGPLTTADVELVHGDVARRSLTRLEKRGQISKDVQRVMEPCQNAAQSWRFGGATMMVRNRAFWSVAV